MSRLVAVAALALLLAGCATAETHHRPGSSHVVATGAPSYDSNGRPYGAAATITIAGGRVTAPPALLIVRRGQTVRLVVTSDRADGVHVPGYGVAKELRPGVPATIELTAERPGHFDVLTRTSRVLLARIAVS